RVYNPVDDDGRFVAEVEHFAGQTVWEANPKIVALLKARGALVAEVPFEHTYPHCWRCKNPTLFRATEQWFAALDRQNLRERTLEAIRRQVRRPAVPQGDRHPRRLVRFRLQPRRRAGGEARAALARRALRRGLRSASRLVPLLAAGVDGHPRPAALPHRADPRLLHRRRGT